MRIYWKLSSWNIHNNHRDSGAEQTCSQVCSPPNPLSRIYSLKWQKQTFSHQMDASTQSITMYYSRLWIQFHPYISSLDLIWNKHILKFKSQHEDHGLNSTPLAPDTLIRWMAHILIHNLRASCVGTHGLWSW